MNAKALRLINIELEEKTGTLDLSELGLEEIPKEVSKFTHLVELHLSENQINKIENLEALTALNTLYLYINIISDQSKHEAADKIKLDF